MDRLNLLSVALGLACLAGLNLYLTVFATGLAIHFHWIALAPQYQSLSVLGQPIVITISGVLFLLEFFADKIPWIDSIWDAVHTIIRPIGGALLAIQVLGHSTPTLDVVIVLLAGTTALATHTAKATTRLLSNTSPEPFSNIALSVGEDAAVIGGLALLHYHPIIALSIFLAGLGAFFYFAPRILRAARVKLWLVWRKLNEPASFHRETSLPLNLPAKLAPIFSKHNLLGETIAWAVPCASGRGRRLSPNIFGALVATNEEPRKLTFVGRKGSKPIAQTIELDGMTIAREPKFLSENLVIFPGAGRGLKYCFVFPRSRSVEVERIGEYLRQNLVRSSPSPAETEGEAALPAGMTKPE
jgi:Domain of unknown function (DUF4126)